MTRTTRSSIAVLAALLAGCTLLPGGQASSSGGQGSGTGGGSGGPAPAPAARRTLLVWRGVSLPMAEKERSDRTTTYLSAYFGLDNAARRGWDDTEGAAADPDHGWLQFALVVSRSNGVRVGGLFLWAYPMYLAAGKLHFSAWSFVDAGEVPFDTRLAPPESGWSRGTVSGDDDFSTALTGIMSMGHLYLLRTDAPPADRHFAKIFLQDLTSERVVFDAALQTASGSAILDTQGVPATEPAPGTAATPGVTASPGTAVTPGASPAPVGAPSPGSTVATPGPAPTHCGAPPCLAPDDARDAGTAHDYVVSREGVSSTFVWIPVFRAYQLINPAACGAANADKPVGYWVREQPPTGTRDVDWAQESFGGFYAGKYEAARADASDTAKGGSTALKVQPRCIPWTDVTWDGALAACRAYGPRADLMGDDEWTALAVWATINGITVQGNNSFLKDDDFPSTRFSGDPTHPAAGRALTGSGTSPGWSGDRNLTTHTGTTAGVYDLNGNVSEWTGTVTANPGGRYLVNGADTGIVAPADGDIIALATDLRLRRYGAPATTGSSGVPFFSGDGFWSPRAANALSTRGGFWNNAYNAGVWLFSVYGGRTGSSEHLGFRPVLRY